MIATHKNCNIAIDTRPHKHGLYILHSPNLEIIPFLFQYNMAS